MALPAYHRLLNLQASPRLLAALASVPKLEISTRTDKVLDQRGDLAGPRCLTRNDRYRHREPLSIGITSHVYIQLQPDSEVGSMKKLEERFLGELCSTVLKTGVELQQELVNQGKSA